MVAYDNDIPVGCVSLKKYDNKSAEVKRVFIKQEYRSKGISRKLIGLLENIVREKGYNCLILESGAPLVAATALYGKIGYKVIPNYGQYKDMPESICMKKIL
ncbi:GNAT family N-acetyltransferase [Blautia hydrogenotrophica]|uniref:GNAT family N-acetyltransferase n=1 Tax=Blautia hydrogenotrophica TaxID=53443 RepID=UPI0025849B23